MENGIFVLSLDFEMMWGSIFNKNVYNGYATRCKNIEYILEGVMNKIQEYDIHATWATVGGIACSSKEEACELASPRISDPYGELSLIDTIKDFPDSLFPKYFDPAFVKKISETPGQELATHTFSHFYLDEHSDRYQKLDDEIKASKTIFNKFNNQVNSIVMPKNQCDNEMLNILAKNQIYIFRGPQVSSFFEKSKHRRIYRFLDAYFPICGSSLYSLKDIYNNGFYNVRASRFFRFYFSKLKFFEFLKLIRVKREIRKCAKKKLVYHLWFHPHNLGTNVNKNLRTLTNLFKYVCKMKKKYNLVSVNMRECCDIYDRNFKKSI